MQPCITRIVQEYCPCLVAVLELPIDVWEIQDEMTCTFVHISEQDDAYKMCSRPTLWRRYIMVLSQRASF